MAIEVEQKFRVVDSASLERRLDALGAVRGEAEQQVDYYFRHPSRDFASTDEALRLRAVGPRNFVTYKGPKLDAVTKTRREVEFEIAPGPESAAAAGELLASLGFSPVAEVRKRRTHFTVRWQDQEVGVALDDVAAVGDFVELEIICGPDEAQVAGECIASLADRLELAGGERRSYLELLLGGRKRPAAL